MTSLVLSILGLATFIATVVLIGISTYIMMGWGFDDWEDAKDYADGRKYRIRAIVKLVCAFLIFILFFAGIIAIPVLGNAGFFG